MLAKSLLALFLATAPLTLMARADDDHERVRAAREAGRILPLKAILERVEAEQPGEILEVELEDEHGRFMYEIKLLRPGGRLAKLYYDAATGEPVDSKRD